MPKSLRRQKILLERELNRLSQPISTTFSGIIIKCGMYIKNENGNYQLSEPLPSDYFTSRDLKIQERNRKRGFDKKIERKINASLKSSEYILKEFEDDFWRT
jgi:hypothetical protein